VEPGWLLICHACTEHHRDAHGDPILDELAVTDLLPERHPFAIAHTHAHANGGL
jgi:hypothetical protein